MPRSRPDADPAPVFVDASGRRGRRLRGLGWVVGVTCVGLAAAMIGGLIGTQSQAPALRVPAGADTTPPSEYLNAPPPAAPRAPSGPDAPAATSSGSPTDLPAGTTTGATAGTPGADAFPTGTTDATGTTVGGVQNTTAP